jgi:hypothetical protein
MPEYLFRDVLTGDEFLLEMSISERGEFMEKNPRITQLVYGFPGIVSGVSKKPEQGFRDLLKGIKKANSRGLRRSTVETF